MFSTSCDVENISLCLHIESLAVVTTVELVLNT